MNEASRQRAIDERKGSYVTSIPCLHGHVKRRFTNSTDCCICYEEWKHRQAVEDNMKSMSRHSQQEPVTYTRKGIGGLQPQAIPKH